MGKKSSNPDDLKSMFREALNDYYKDKSVRLRLGKD